MWAARCVSQSGRSQLRTMSMADVDLFPFDEPELASLGRDRPHASGQAGKSPWSQLKATLEAGGAPPAHSSQQWIGVDELRKDVMSLMARETDGSGQTDLYALAEHLALLKHWRQVTVRTGLTLHTGIRDGSSSTALFKQLRHSFLLVQPSAAGPKLLIDPHFRDQFALGASTPEYRDLLSAIPPLFIGFPGTVAQLAPLMANKMSESMSTLGLPCPPWRDAEALLSLWTPTNYTDDVHIPTSKQPSLPSPSPSPFSPFASANSQSSRPDPSTTTTPSPASNTEFVRSGTVDMGRTTSAQLAVALATSRATRSDNGAGSGVVVHRLSSVLPPTAASFGASAPKSLAQTPQPARASGWGDAARGAAASAAGEGSDTADRHVHSSVRRPVKPIRVMGFNLPSETAGVHKVTSTQPRTPRFSMTGVDTSGEQDGKSLSERLHAAVAGGSGSISRVSSAQTMSRNGSAHNLRHGTMSRTGSATNVFATGVMSRTGSATNVSAQ